MQKGHPIGKYQRFTIQAENWATVCKIAIHGVLDDCTDRHARTGSNHYRIGAEYDGGSWIPDNYYADTLQEDRTQILQ